MEKKMRKQVQLIKLHNLKYSAHNKNYTMILEIGCEDMC